MSEPDKAILWARERAARWQDESGGEAGPSYRSGKLDFLLGEEVEGYRAGQAASAERIKALKKLVQNLMLEVRARTMRSNTPLTTNIVEMTVPDRVALLKEADQ